MDALSSSFLAMASPGCSRSLLLRAIQMTPSSSSVYRRPPQLLLTITAAAASFETADDAKRGPTLDEKTMPKITSTTVRAQPKQQEKIKEKKITHVSRAPRSAAAAVRRPPPPPPVTSAGASMKLSTALCNAVEDLINNFIDPPVHRPSVDPRYVLSDNFAPVPELPPTPCPVVRGAIPPCLGGGAYIRNGPNPQYLPRGPHHLFDGDGMLHSLLLPSGGGTAPATLCSRYVRTYKYVLERDAGASVFPNVFSGFHGPAGIARGAVSAARVLTGQMNPGEGVGLANTSLVYHAGRLYALGESDLPYAVHLSSGHGGDISTLGRYDFQGKVWMGMTAHPKKDPFTGEMFAFRYGPVPPYVTYFRFDKEGNKEGADVPIFSVAQPSFLHDFAITERYAIFPDIQMVMKPMDMVLGGGSPVGSDKGKVPRLGLLPRYATSESEMRWFEVPGFNVMHTLNAWEEDDGDTVVVVAPNVLSIEHALERMELVHSCVEMVRIHLRTTPGGAVSRTPLSAGNLDFGVIHPGYVGRRNRYAYLGLGDPMPKICGVVKLDFETAGKGDCVVASREFGPGCFGGEPFFVPAAASSSDPEDEGYVVSYVHDEKSGESKFVVMDAQSPHLEIVAEVLLPRRVPYGFHGLFLTQAEIQGQRPPLV